MVVCIAFGYLVFLMYFVIGLFVCCFVTCAVFRRRGEGGFNINNNSVLKSVPYLNALSSLKKKNYADLKAKDMDTCVICLMDYGPQDEVSELNCDSRHYFHSACMEDWLKKK
jgi:hypothetical protein